MNTTTTATRRGIAVGLAIAMLGLLLWQTVGDDAEATPAALPTAAFLQTGGDDVLPVPSNQAWFARYDGFDGESQDENHDKWIDILSIDWGVHRSTAAGASGSTRHRAAPALEDFVISFPYEKAAPKLLEKCLRGEVIPKLEIELTTTFGFGSATYLRYEMKNVSCTAYDVGGTAAAGRPIVVVGNNFEEVKVTYTEYDEAGNSRGNVETEWKVEKGE